MLDLIEYIDTHADGPILVLCLARPDLLDLDLDLELLLGEVVLDLLGQLVPELRAQLGQRLVAAKARRLAARQNRADARRHRPSERIYNAGEPSKAWGSPGSGITWRRPRWLP